MSRLERRNLREEFADLYHFIETELTEENWIDLFYKAAVSAVPSGAKLTAHRPHKGIRVEVHGPNPVTNDILDLTEARHIQAWYRYQLDLISRGGIAPILTSFSRLLDGDFSRLKQILVRHPEYTESTSIDGIPAAIVRGSAYDHYVARRCPYSGEEGCRGSYTTRPADPASHCQSMECKARHEKDVRVGVGKKRSGHRSGSAG